MDYITDKKEIGKRLKAIRKMKYKSQEAFAEDLNISDRKTVSKWETGETEIPMTRLPDICNALECDMDYIFGKINTPKNCTTNVMQETGLSFQAADLLLNKKYTFTLNSLLADENFIKLLDIIREWYDADANNTQGEIIKYNIKNKLGQNSSYTKEVSKVLSRISKDGIQILYRPIAQETANKMFDSVTTAMYREDINNG